MNATSTTSMQQVLPLWGRFIWRFWIYTMLWALLLGGIAGAIAGFLGHGAEAREWGGVVGMFAFLPGSLYALKHALTKWIESNK